VRLPLKLVRALVPPDNEYLFSLVSILEMMEAESQSLRKSLNLLPFKNQYCSDTQVGKRNQSCDYLVSKMVLQVHSDHLEA
jgi:hypothetical protein